jgi:hypothetical protein
VQAAARYGNQDADQLEALAVGELTGLAPGPVPACMDLRHGADQLLAGGIDTLNLAEQLFQVWQPGIRRLGIRPRSVWACLRIRPRSAWACLCIRPRSAWACLRIRRAP